MYARIREYLSESPVRTRALVVAALAMLVQYVPALAGWADNEAVVGGVVAVVALWLGETGQRKEDAKTDAARFQR